MEPVKSFKGGVELAYISPFRNEKEPSLFVNIRKNLWNDFGDMGGNALDFVIRYCNTDVKGALEILDRHFGSEGGAGTLPLPFKKQVSKPETEKEESTFLLDRVLPFGASAPSLVTYITQTRKINPEIAAHYLKEVYFHNRYTGKKYFAAGFENMSGGYEIRNPFFKGSVGSKDMSFIKGTGDGKEVWVFEGFMDFLSKLTLRHSGNMPTTDCLVLNSVSNTEKTIGYLLPKPYEVVFGYLDNDSAGEKSTNLFKSRFQDRFIDQRCRTTSLKDINELLCAK